MGSPLNPPQGYPLGSTVIYAGRLYRVIGATDTHLEIRLVSWEYSWGLWGWDGYGNPIAVATTAPVHSPLLYPG